MDKIRRSTLRRAGAFSILAAICLGPMLKTVPALAVGPTTSYFSAWAGAIDQDKAQANVHGAIGTFIVPVTTCSGPSTSVASFWVGIGGDQKVGGAVEKLYQDGISASCKSNGTTYQAWQEAISTGQPAVNLPVTVLAGDRITASVIDRGLQTHWSLIDVRNGSQVWQQTGVWLTSYVHRHTAECIAEDPEPSGASGPSSDFADFGTIRFSTCQAVDQLGGVWDMTGSTLPFGWNAVRAEMMTLPSRQILESTNFHPLSVSWEPYIPPAFIWHSPQVIDSGNAVGDISCRTSSSCAAVDFSGNALTFGGSTWTSPQSIDPFNNFQGVSCATPTYCMAITGSGQREGGDRYFAFDGSRWGSSQAVGAGFPLQSISCAAPRFCVVTDIAGDVFVFNGTSWAETELNATEVITSVSCPNAQFCEAVDSTGNAYRFNGRNWGSPQRIDPAPGFSGGHRLNSISCPSSSFCLASDYDGNVVTFDGSSWAKPQHVEPSNEELIYLSCTGSDFCGAIREIEAGGGPTSVVMYQDGQWSRPVNIAPDRHLTGISCPTTQVCAVSDFSGSVVFGT